MSLQHQNTKVLGYFSVFLGFVILLLIARPAYYSITERQADISAKQTALQTKQTELNRLNTMKMKVEKAKKWNSDFSRFIKEYDTNELFTYVYEYAQKNSSIAAYQMEIESLEISEPETTEMWMNKVTVTVNANFSSLRGVTKFLDYMTDTANPYSFYMTDISLPEIENEGVVGEPISVSLPFIFFYK